MDIQALRGLAILLVVLHHAQVPMLPAGYLGVDVFFVISGYLITGLVRRAIVQGEFSFSEFYFRRAKRLLPAAYVTFLAAAILAPQILNVSELEDFFLQLVGAITFTGNIVLWQQTDYFEAASELKPLLHVWSLAIEEQYYFLLPAALVSIPRRHWLPVALVAFIVSLGLCWLGGYFKPVATFYLLPFRGWELAVGSIGALVRSDGWLQKISHILFAPALIAVIAIPLFPIGGNHPGWDALTVCLATLIIIRRQHPLLNAHAPAKVLASIGDFSYSLYLVHWPLFAFVSSMWIGGRAGEVPPEIRAAVVASAFVLGYLLFRFVERPIHRTKFTFSLRLMATTVAASVGLIFLTGATSSGTIGNTDGTRSANRGFGPECATAEGPFVPLPECRNADRPKILIWGDSYAMHLVSGIAATSGESGVVQATRSYCGPLLDVAPLNRPGSRHTVLTQNWGDDCLQFNDSVVHFLAASPWIEMVVLSSPLVQYLNSPDYRLLRRRGAEYSIADPSVDETLAGLSRTVDAIRALGKRVVLVAPPPSAGFNAGACRERLNQEMLFLRAPLDCEISVEEYRSRKRELLAFLTLLPPALDIAVFSFDSALCNEEICTTEIDATPLYWDAGHLSYEGSRVIAARVNLAAQLQELAR